MNPCATPVYLPVLASLLFVLPGVTAVLSSLADRIDPRWVVRLLTAVILALATSGGLTLALLTVGGLARLAAGPGVLVGRHADPGGLPAAAVASGLLVALLIRVAHTLLRHATRRRQVRAVLPWEAEHGVTVIEDDAVYAVATPGRGRDGGRIVTTRGLWTALDPGERDVVLAHERAHLDGHHHRFLMIATLAVALNPCLVAVRRAIAYALERCADEAAARAVGDRSTAARAVGRAALAASRRPASPASPALAVDPAVALGVATGPVPRRVAALLVPSERCAGAWLSRLRRPASALRATDLTVRLVVAFVIALGGAFVMVAVLHAAWDLGDVHGLRGIWR